MNAVASILDNLMLELQLISHHLCPYVQRAVIVLSEKNIEHKRTYIDLADKPEWFANVSPLGRVPVLVTQGAVVFESQVIAEYLDEVTDGSLHPKDALRKAHHRSWIEFGSETLSAIGAFYNAKNKEAFEEKQLALRQKFERIDLEIKGPYFDGDLFHMVGGVWGTIFKYLDTFDKMENFNLLTSLDNVVAWRKLISLRPSTITAAPQGYDERLMVFLKKKNTYISQLIL